MNTEANTPTTTNPTPDSKHVSMSGNPHVTAPPPPLTTMMTTTTTASGKPFMKDPPRLVRRNLPFNQSRNILQVEHNQGKRLSSLIRHDYFHVILRLPIWFTLMLLLFLWTLIIIVFGGLYVAVDRINLSPVCGLGKAGEPFRFYAAFAYSIETCTDVGYR
jgi:hypothetical protein